MQKPAGKQSKAAREIAFLSNRLDALEAELKRIREQSKVIRSSVYQLYCSKCGNEMGLGNEIQAGIPHTCTRCARGSHEHDETSQPETRSPKN